MKYILLFLIVITTIGIASADYSVGPSIGGNIWAGNSSSDNTTEDISSDRIWAGIFADSFSDGNLNGWYQRDGTWTVENNAAKISNNYGTGRLSNNLTFPSNHLFFARVNITGGAGYQHAGLIYNNSNTSTTESLTITDPSNNTRLEWGASSSNVATYINLSEWYTLEYIINGSYIRTWTNSILKHDRTVVASDGNIGFRLYKATAYFDDARVLALDSSNDAITSGNISVWHDAGSGQETYQITINCTTPANTNYTVYYRSNNTGNYVSLASAQTGNQTISISGTKYQNTDIRVKLFGNTTQTPELLGITFEIQVTAGAAPSITSYAPTGSIYPEVGDSQLFNVTVNQSTACHWYVNGTLVETDSSHTEHSYTNTSLNGGGCNVTADVGNANGNDTKTWLFEVGADSISYIILQDTPTNQSMIFEVNITRVGHNVTDWGRWQNHTFDGWDYTFRYANGTAIKSLTASGNNDTLWFNHTSLLHGFVDTLPTGVYFINATDTSTGIETFVNPTFVSAGAAAILFVAAAGRFAISAWRNRRRKRRN